MAVPWWCSTASDRTPWCPSRRAVDNPTRLPPTIKTGTSVSLICLSKPVGGDPRSHDAIGEHLGADVIAGRAGRHHQRNQMLFARMRVTCRRRPAPFAKTLGADLRIRRAGGFCQPGIEPVGPLSRSSEKSSHIVV